MSLGQIDRNLILFVDPLNGSSRKWRFLSWTSINRRISTANDQNIVCRFSRSDLHRYLFTLIKLKFGTKCNIKTALFVNDGLLSSIFYADRTDFYRLFARNHLTKLMTFRQKITSRLPLIWRAETRFLIIFNDIYSPENNDDGEMDKSGPYDFMFFSNAAGKLLLLNAETLRTGQGELVKTTTNSDYVRVMEKEFSTLLKVSNLVRRTGWVPTLGKRFEVRGQFFYTEGYLRGESLRFLLRRYGSQMDSNSACSLLHSLGEWFEFYIASFNGNSAKFSELTTHLLPLFSSAHPQVDKELISACKRILSKLDTVISGVLSVTSHNDLWPGNFIMTREGLAVIDWERATEKRAPLFDYFWMVISAVMEFLFCQIGANDHSKAFHIFLVAEDVVSKQVHLMIKLFMKRLGIPESFFNELMFLFLVELSVQGFQALGRQTDLDRFALKELSLFLLEIEPFHNRSMTC